MARELLYPLYLRPDGKTFPLPSPRISGTAPSDTMSLNLIDLSATSGQNAEMNTLKSISPSNTPPGATGFGDLFAAQMQNGTPNGLSGAATGEGLSLDTTKDGWQTLADDLGTATPSVMDPSGLMPGVPPAWMPQNLGLTAVPLGPRLQAITTDMQSPDTDSLLAFARAQGFDESALGWLMRNAPTSATPGSLEIVPGMVTGTQPLSGSGMPGDSLLTGQGLAFTAAAMPPNQPLSMNVSAMSEPQNVTGQAGNTLIAGLAALQNPPSGPGAPLTLEDLAGTAQTAADNATASGETLMLHLRLAGMPAAWRNLQQPAADPAAAAGKASSGAAEDPWTSELDLGDIVDGLNIKPQAESPTVATSTRLLQQAVLRDGNPALALLSAATGGNDSTEPPTEGDPTGDSVTALGSVADGRAAKPQDSAAPASAARPAAGPGAAERAESLQSQADKMGQAIGQRMLSEIEKGHWHLKMMLRPAQLGHIEVEMRLRGGELDAQFTAPHALTRDLLQDGLPRLRDTLTQMGMDVANMHVRDGSGRSGGGDSTPGQQQAAPQKAAASRTPESDLTASPVVSRRTSSDGWDVLV